MNRVWILALAILMATAAAARAQDQNIIFYQAAPLSSEPGQIAPGPDAAVMFERPVEMMMAEPLDVGDPVTDAPYSAVVTTEIVQVLADGNRIERRSTSSVARDSQGRVRRTRRLAAVGPLLPRGDAEIVTINDPVARVHYSLDTNRKVATQLPMMFTKRLEGPPAAAAAHLAGQPRDVRTETLGTRSIDGITAEGTRSVVIIAAGAIGNQAPIEIVSERWFSPELQTVVLSRRSDPRFGETTFRLENIDRSEPAPELFEIPSDFTVQAGRPPFGAGVRIERRIVR